MDHLNFVGGGTSTSMIKYKKKLLNLKQKSTLDHVNTQKYYFYVSSIFEETLSLYYNLYLYFENPPPHLLIFLSF